MLQHIPEIKDSFPEMEKLFTSKNLTKFMQTPAEELHLYHIGLGTWIRNNLLQNNSSLCQFFLKQQVTHPDDMSAIVMEEFQEYLKEKYQTKKKPVKKKK